jgi:transketolase
MEGISHEAAALAGHQKLGKLIWIFDDNRITIDGSTDLATSTDHAKRFEAYGWHVQHVDDGNDLGAIDAAIAAAKAETGRPSFIVLRTTIAWGSPGKAGTPRRTARRSAPPRSRPPRRTWATRRSSRSGSTSGRGTHWAECVERGARLHGAWRKRSSPRTRRRIPSWRPSSCGRWQAISPTDGTQPSPTSLG